jgi:SAM-dependent methyltransferase
VIGSLRQPEPEDVQRAYYRRTSAVYDELHTEAPDEHSFALEHVLFYLRWCGATSVLDSGCGTGRALRFLHERAPDLRLWGNDPSPDLLSIATREHGIPSEQLDCVASDELPYGDGAFDAVVETGVLHHVADPGRLVSEFLRVARKAVFLSDSNIYGSGRHAARLAKVALGRARLLGPVNWLRRAGRHWYYSADDGVAYSYSVLDAVPLLRRMCDLVLVVPTDDAGGPAGVPLLSSPHVLVCGFKEPLPGTGASLDGLT